MNHDVLKQAAQYSKEHRKKNRRFKALGAMAAVVVFCTTYALILPAATLEKKPEPVLVCELEEHVHDESCYGEVLTCGLEEFEGEVHEHSDECYTVELVTEEVLTCAEEETEGHTHGEDCYTVETVTSYRTEVEEITETVTVEDTETQDILDEEGNVIGTEEVVVGTHEETVVVETREVQVEDGTEEVRTLTCTEEETESHTHSADCYETVENEVKTLTCELEEAISHTHSEECYETGLICGLEEHEHDDYCYAEEISDEDVALDGTPFWTADETYGNRFYQTVFHVEYYGETTEDDELTFTTQSTTQDEMDSDRDWEYLSLLPDGRILPMGRTEFALTLNGETVDRSEYSVYVEIIPSRESVAYLAMSLGGGTDTMMLDLYDDEGGEGTMVVPGFGLYELMGGELVMTGHVDADLESLDLYSYMDAAYDEDGNPTYDEAYAVSAEVYGEDFMVTAGVAEDIIDTLGSVGQVAWHDDTYVWWRGYTPSSNKDGTDGTGSDAGSNHVSKVYFTHSNASGVVDNSDSKIEINMGTGESHNANAAGGTILKGSSYIPCDSPDQATRITVNWTHKKYGSSSDTILQGDSKWNQAKSAVVGGNWEWMLSGPWGDATVTSIIYETQDPNNKGIYPLATTKNIDYALLEIEPEPGYYVTQLVIVCSNGHGGPFSCSVWSNHNDGLFTEKFGISDGTKVSLTVPSEAFCHYSNSFFGMTVDDVYYVLIATAPIPSPLFVSYDPGVIGNTNVTSDAFFTSGKEWLDGNGRTTVAGNNIMNATTVDQLQKMASTSNWSEGELDYYVSGISAEAEAKANEAGYRFTGWRLEYWGDVTKDIKNPYTDVNDIQNVKNQFPSYTSNEQTNLDNGFAGDVFISKDQLGSARNLMTNAKLIAQWEPIPAAEVVKRVVNVEEDIPTEREFTFTITSSDGEDFTFTGEKPTYTYVNGVAIRQTTSETISSVNGVATISFTVLGNDSRSYEISGLPSGDVTYTVLETTTGEFKTTYENQTFKVQNTDGTITAAQTVTVTNDYDTSVKTVEMTVEKRGFGPNEVIFDGEVPMAAGLPLSGAEFELYLKGSEDTKVAVLTTQDGQNGNLGKSEAVTLNTGKENIYYLIETKAPNGYNQLTDPIYFYATENGLVLCDADGEEITYNQAAVDNLNLLVANLGGYVLPSTGGPGTAWMYALGSALLLAAAAAATLVYKKPKREEGRA